MTATTNLDHLVIAATSLEQGAAWAKSTLGIDVPYGGEHPQMGTHNLVMSLGNGVYFEIIAINPDAPAPNRPRWFSLDDPYVQMAIAKSPRLLTWVVNTTDAVAMCAQNDFPHGVPTPMRRGALRWLFTIPEDGQLPAAGMLPTLIEWQTEPHPSVSLPELGVTYKSLTLHHPYPEWAAARLSEINAAHLAEVQGLPANALPYFEVTLETPKGELKLSSQMDV